MAVLVQKTINLVILKIAENGCIGTRISRRRNSGASILCLCLAYSLTPNGAFLCFSSIPLKWWSHLASIDIIFSRSFTDLQPVIWRTKSSYIPFEIYSLSFASCHSRLCRPLSYPPYITSFPSRRISGCCRNPQATISHEKSLPCLWSYLLLSLILFHFNIPFESGEQKLHTAPEFWVNHKCAKGVF